MAFDSTFPQDNSPATAAGMRQQLNALKALIEAVYPVGCVTGYLKSLANVPALPGSWVECTGQIINDAGSPLNGANAPDLNGAQGGAPCFLRGAMASGSTGGDEFHSHGLALNVNGGIGAQGADLSVFPPGNYTSDPASSLPPYCDVVWVMRVK
jgi:hypothetical protein